jgi:autotransporter-associated beta strand protein
MLCLSGSCWHGGFVTKWSASILVLLFLATQMGSAATRVWSAPPFGGDRRWSVAANWSGVVPVNGDSLVFPEISDATFPQESTNNLSNLQLNSITLSATANAVPDVYGNGITLSGGITESVSFWGAAFFVPITLSANQVFESSIDGRLELTNINLSTRTLTLNARAGSSRIQARGRISGSGGIVVTGEGMVAFNAPLTNTYTGLTRIDSGELTLSATDGVNGIPSVPGDVIVGDGANTATLRVSRDNQVEGDIVVNTGSQLVLASTVSDVIPSLGLNDATVVLLDNSSLILGGPLTVGGTSNSTIRSQGSLSLGSTGLRTIAITNDVVLRVEAEVSGTGLGFTRPGIVKTGEGTLLLLSNNTFNGAVSINQGRVIAAAPRALGTASGDFLNNPVGRTFVNEGGELLLASVRVTNEVLTLGTTQGGLGSTGSCAWIGEMILTTNVPVNVSNSTLTVEGTISGAGGLVKNAAGTLTLTGTNANTFTGLTRHQTGLLLLSKPANVLAIPGPLIVGNSSGGANADIVRVQQAELISDSVHVTVTSSGQLDLNAAETIGSLSGSGQVRLDGGELTLGGNGTSTNFSGTIVGTFGLTKIGAGTQTLSGNNSYTGLTRILSGALRVDGSQPSSPVSVIGANLEGGGTVGHVTSNGRVAPGGAGFDILSTSNLTFQAGGSLDVQLGGRVPGSNQDQLLVRGSVALANATLTVSLSPGYLPASGDTFLILNNDAADAIGGIFGGLANNSFVTLAPGKRFRIQYNAGDGNDVMLTFTNETVALRPLALSSGNGNTRLDPNECLLLSGSLTNQSGQVLSNVTVEFFPQSAGLTISHPSVFWGQLPPNVATPIPAQIVVSVASNVVCGDLVFMDAEMRSGGAFVSSTTFAFVVGPGGIGNCTDGGGICNYCPEVMINGTLGTGDILQNSALVASGAPTQCGDEKSCPGASGSGTRQVDVLVFQNGPRAACITVTLSNLCHGANSELFAAAYRGAFNPSNLCANYLADMGDSIADGKSGSFSFRIGGGALFTLTVNELKAGGTCGDYSLFVTGGDCRPRLQLVDLPGANMRLSWPNSGAEWVPQFSGALTNWADLPGTRTNVGGHYQLDTPGTQPARFFRLREP